MPADFEKAVKSGAKVITKKLPGGKYIHLAKTKSGKWVKGEVKKKKNKKAKKSEWSKLSQR